MIKKTNKYKILITFLTFSVLFSCNFKKKPTSENEYPECVIDSTYFLPVTYNLVKSFLNISLDISINNLFFDVNDFKIYPYFCTKISDITILSQINGMDTVIEYNIDELNQFVDDINCFMGESVLPFMHENFSNIVADGISKVETEVIFYLAPPFVDRKNSLVFVIINSSAAYYGGNWTTDYLYIYKSISNGEDWDLFNIIEIDRKWNANEEDKQWEDDYVPYRLF